MRIAAFQPDIPGNLGALMRLSVCFGAELHVIQPCGFPYSAKAVRRAAMDYGREAVIVDHASWSAFLTDRREGRLVLMTTRGAVPHWDVEWRESDFLLLGRESAGVPEEVHAISDERARIEMPGGGRSLNMAIAAGIALAEATRQFAAAP